MTSQFDKEILKHPIIIGSFGVVAIIALGSGAYYLAATHAPSGAPTINTSVTTSSVIATGSVEPAQNPDLAFQTSGRVARIDIAVGATVYKGQVLAALDTAALSAARAQAAATQKSQQATLDSMKAGARQVDIDAKQTALDTAKQNLTNDYVNAINTAQDGYGKAYSAIHTYTDSLFSNPDTQSPSLLVQSSDSQTSSNLVTSRIVIGNELAQWKQDLAALSDDSSPEQREAALAKANTHLGVLRSYSNSVIELLASAIPSTSFPSSSLASAYVSANALRDSVSSLIATNQTQTQRIAADKLAVRSATDALAQTTAGSTPQDIEAQEARVEAAAAQVAAADAQISNAVIVAPFDGTVASVHADIGDSAAANTPVISLMPHSALQVRAYLSASDAVRVQTGEAAQITLDAYGSSRTFPATVTVVDSAPTIQNGVPAYKITLQFDQNDTAIGVGMNANITILSTK